MAKISMLSTDKPFTIFSDEADKDYLLARWISKSGSAFQNRAGFFAQQASEKYMKALIVQASAQYLETHKLLELQAACSAYYPALKDSEFIAALKRFDPFDQVGRYGAAANFDPHARKEEEFETSGVWVWTEAYLQALDHVAFSTRSALDYSTVNGADHLSDILNNNSRNYFVSTWRGDSPLFQILTQNNQHFRR